MYSSPASTATPFEPRPPEVPGGRSGRPPLFTRAFLALMCAQAGFGYAFSSFLMLPKFLATQLGEGPETIGWVTALGGAVAGLVLLPMGVLVDRHGRRSFLMAGGVVMALASAGFVWVESAGWLLYTLRGAQCVAFAMAFAAGSALCVDEAPEERLGQAIGLFGLTFVAMGAIAPAAVELLVDRFGWSAAFLMSSAAAVLCSLLTLTVRDHRPAPENGAQTPLWEIARRPKLLRAAVVVTMIGIALCAAANFYQPFALELGHRELRTFFMGFTAAVVFTRLGVGPFVDRMQRRHVALVSLGIYALSMMAMAELGRFELASIGFCIGLGHGLAYPIYNAIAVDGVADHERGKVMALVQAWFNFGVTIGGVGLGLLAGTAGYPPVFLVAAACLVIAVAVVAASPDGRRRAPTVARDDSAQREAAAPARVYTGDRG